MLSRLFLPSPPPSSGQGSEKTHIPPVAGYSPGQAVFHGEYIELFAPERSEVLSPAPGRVVVAEGNTLLLEHPDGTRTWFDGLALDQHMEAGKEVAGGKVLGRVPRGGSVKAAHIRWGALDQAGKPTDPRARLITKPDAIILLVATALMASALVFLPSIDPPLFED